MFKWDVKNDFSYGDLYKEVHMEQPPGYITQGGECGMITQESKLWT